MFAFVSAFPKSLHCTDEAQQAETVLSAVLSIYIYIAVRNVTFENITINRIHELNKTVYAPDECWAKRRRVIMSCNKFVFLSVLYIYIYIYI